MPPPRLLPVTRQRRRLALGLVLLAALAAMLSIQGLGAPYDIDHYKYWTRLVTDGGIQAAYSGTFPHSYAIYPPFLLYFFWLAGQAYVAFIDPVFDIQRALTDPALTFVVKTPGMIFHLLTIGLIYYYLSRRLGVRSAFIGSLAYGLNPGVLMDIAVWGQPNSAHSFFVLSSLVLLVEGRPGLAGAAYGLAAMTKPQSWILAPLIGLYVWHTYGYRRAGRFVCATASSIVVLSAPFWLSGRVGELLRLPISIASVEPWVSANGHSFWWLLLGENARFLPDFERTALGPSWMNLARTLVALAIVFCLSQVWKSRDRGWRSLPALAALQSFAFFFLATRAHEDHAFMVLPLLALLWPPHKGIGLLYFGVSITFVTNLLLHDPVLAPRINTELLGGQIDSFQAANAAANLIIVLCWLAATVVVGLKETRTRSIQSPVP